MLPLQREEQTTLIVTSSMGLFKYDGIDFIPFTTEADKFIKENVIHVHRHAAFRRKYITGNI